MSSNRWTKEDIDFLKKSYRNVPVVEIASHLNKTQAAVTTQAWKQGLAGRERGKKKSNRDEELLEYVSYGFKPYQIANIMGMNEERVKTIIRGHS
jgi:FixJ family two-component response regulator